MRLCKDCAFVGNTSEDGRETHSSRWTCGIPVPPDMADPLTGELPRRICALERTDAWGSDDLPNKCGKIGRNWAARS